MDFRLARALRGHPMLKEVELILLISKKKDDKQIPRGLNLNSCIALVESLMCSNIIDPRMKQLMLRYPNASFLLHIRLVNGLVIILRNHANQLLVAVEGVSNSLDSYIRSVHPMLMEDSSSSSSVITLERVKSQLSEMKRLKLEPPQPRPFTSSPRLRKDSSSSSSVITLERVKSQLSEMKRLKLEPPQPRPFTSSPRLRSPTPSHYLASSTPSKKHKQKHAPVLPVIEEDWLPSDPIVKFRLEKEKMHTVAQASITLIEEDTNSSTHSQKNYDALLDDSFESPEKKKKDYNVEKEKMDTVPLHTQAYNNTGSQQASITLNEEEKEKKDTLPLHTQAYDNTGSQQASITLNEEDTYYSSHSQNFFENLVENFFGPSEKKKNDDNNMEKEKMDTVPLHTQAYDNTGSQQSSITLNEEDTYYSTHSQNYYDNLVENFFAPSEKKKNDDNMNETESTSVNRVSKLRRVSFEGFSKVAQSTHVEQQIKAPDDLTSLESFVPLSPISFPESVVKLHTINSDILPFLRKELPTNETQHEQNVSPDLHSLDTLLRTSDCTSKAVLKGSQNTRSPTNKSDDTLLYIRPTNEVEDQIYSQDIRIPYTTLMEGLKISDSTVPQDDTLLNESHSCAHSSPDHLCEDISDSLSSVSSVHAASIPTVTSASTSSSKALQLAEEGAYGFDVNLLGFDNREFDNVLDSIKIFRTDGTQLKICRTEDARGRETLCQIQSIDAPSTSTLQDKTQWTPSIDQQAEASGLQTVTDFQPMAQLETDEAQQPPRHTQDPKEVMVHLKNLPDPISALDMQMIFNEEALEQRVHPKLRPRLPRPPLTDFGPPTRRKRRRVNRPAIGRGRGAQPNDEPETDDSSVNNSVISTAHPDDNDAAMETSDLDTSDTITSEVDITIDTDITDEMDISDATVQPEDSADKKWAFNRQQVLDVMAGFSTSTIKFSECCDPRITSRRGAASFFNQLISLNAAQKIQMTQTTPGDPDCIFIEAVDSYTES